MSRKVFRGFCKYWETHRIGLKFLSVFFVKSIQLTLQVYLVTTNFSSAGSCDQPTQYFTVNNRICVSMVHIRQHLAFSLYWIIIRLFFNSELLLSTLTPTTHQIPVSPVGMFWKPWMCYFVSRLSILAIKITVVTEQFYRSYSQKRKDRNNLFGSMTINILPYFGHICYCKSMC